MKTKIHFFKRILLQFWAFSTHILKECTKSEVNKYVTISILLTVPIILAAISYSNAFNFIFDNPYQAVAFGIVSAGFIWAMDRGFVVHGRPGKLSTSTLVRFILAIVLATLIAEPLAITVFKDSIIEHQNKAFQNDKNTIEISYNDKLTTVELALKPKEEALYILQREASREADGTGGSGIRNMGPIYKMKNNNYLKAKEEYDEQVLIAANKVKQLLSFMESEIKDLKDNQAKGIIGALRTLNSLSKEEPIVFYSLWLLRIALILIEILPIIMLKLSKSDNQDLYHKVKDMKDNEWHTAMSSLQNENLENILQQMNNRILEERYLIKSQSFKHQLKAAELRRDAMLKAVWDKAILEYDLKHKGLILEDENIQQTFFNEANQILNNFNKTLNSLHINFR
jgi:hypothetical protein